MKKKFKGISRDLEYTSSISFQIAAMLKRKLVQENINSACDFSLDAKGHKDRSQEVSPIVIAEKLASKLETSDGLSGFLVQACNGHLNFMSLSVSEGSVHSFHSKKIIQSWNVIFIYYLQEKLEVIVKETKLLIIMKVFSIMKNISWRFV